MTSIPDETRLLQSGDEPAFNRLYADLAPCVLGYLLRLTNGSRTDAEDLTQETFLAAYVGRGSFTGRSQPLAWLLGVARRRWRDKRRSPAPSSTALTDSIADTTAEDSDLSERVTQNVVLETALNGLEDAQREAIVLVVVQGLTYKEAADILGQPVGTVKWRVHEATRALRKNLQSTFVQAETENTANRSHLSAVGKETDYERTERQQKPA